MPKKKYVLSVVLFLVLIFGTYYFVFKGYPIQEFLSSLVHVSPIYIGIACLCMFFWAFFEALYLKRMCKHLGYRINWYQAFGYVFTECYFSAITPSSIGGQPVQMMEMSKDGIPYRVNSMIILLNTMIYKVALIFLAILGMIFYSSKLFSFNTLFNWLVLLGFGTTILVIICFILLVYSKKLMYRIVSLVIKLLKKLRFVKNTREKEASLKASLRDYQECAKTTRQHPWILLESFVILVFQRLSILAVSYVIYRSFGLSDLSIFEVIAFQVFITLGSDFMPFPGGVVVAEGLLLEANKVLYGSELATSGMILLRSISFYGIVLFSFIAYLYFHFVKRKKAKILERGSV